VIAQEETSLEAGHASRGGDKKEEKTKKKKGPTAERNPAASGRKGGERGSPA